MCWDVRSGQAVSGLDDPWQAATGRSNPRPGGVRALAWVMSEPCLLAVALTHILIIWDPRGKFLCVHYPADINAKRKVPVPFLWISAIRSRLLYHW